MNISFIGIVILQKAVLTSYIYKLFKIKMAQNSPFLPSPPPQITPSYGVNYFCQSFTMTSNLCVHPNMVIVLCQSFVYLTRNLTPVMQVHSLLGQ